MWQTLTAILVLALLHTAHCGTSTSSCSTSSECCVNKSSYPALTCKLQNKDACTVLLGDCVGSKCTKMTSNSPTKLVNGCTCTKNSDCTVTLPKKTLACGTQTAVATCKNNKCVENYSNVSYKTAGTACTLSTTVSNTDCTTYKGTCNGKSTDCQKTKTFKAKGTLCNGTTKPTNECGGEYYQCDGSGTCKKVTTYKSKGTLCNNSKKPSGDCGGVYYQCDGQGTCKKETTYKAKGTVCGGTSKDVGVCGGTWKECDGKGLCVAKQQQKATCGTPKKTTCKTTSYICENYKCVTKVTNEPNGKVCDGKKSSSECGGSWSECKEGMCVKVNTIKNKGTLCNNSKKPTNECGGTYYECDGNGKCTKKNNHAPRGTFCNGSTQIPSGVCGGKYYQCDGNGHCVSKKNYKAAGYVCGGTKAACGTWKECNGSGLCVTKTKTVTCPAKRFTTECSVIEQKLENCVCTNKTTYVKQGTECGAERTECGEWSACDGHGKCVKQGRNKQTGDTCGGTTKPSGMCGGSWKECNANGKCVLKEKRLPKGSVCMPGYGLEMQDRKLYKPKNECGGKYYACDANSNCVATDNLVKNGVLCANSTKPTSVCGGKYYTCADGKCVANNNYAKKGTRCGSSTTGTECGRGSSKECDGQGNCVTITEASKEGQLCGGSKNVSELGECGGVIYQCANGKCVAKNQFKAKGTLCNGSSRPTGECGGAWYECNGNGKCEHKTNYKKGTCGGTVKPSGFCGGSWKECSNGQCVSKSNKKPDGTSCSSVTPTDTGCGVAGNVCKNGTCVVKNTYKPAGTSCGSSSEDVGCGTIVKKCDGKGKCVTTNTIKAAGTLCNGSVKKEKECGTSWYECDSSQRCVQRNNYSVAGTLCGGSTAKPSSKCGGRWSECDGKGTCVKKTNFRPEGFDCGSSNRTDAICGSTRRTCDGKGVCRSVTKNAKRGTLCGGTTKPANFCGGAFKQCDGNGNCIKVQNYKAEGTDCSEQGSASKNATGTNICTLPGRQCDGKGLCVSTSTTAPTGTVCGKETQNECYTTTYTCADGACIKKKRMKSYGTLCGGTSLPTSECGGTYKICDGNGECVQTSMFTQDGTPCGSSVEGNKTECYSSTKVCKQGKCTGKTVAKARGTVCGEVKKKLCTEITPMCDGNGNCVDHYSNKTENTSCGSTVGDPDGFCGGSTRVCMKGKCYQKTNFKARGTLCGESQKKTVDGCLVRWYQCDGQGKCVKASSKRPVGSSCGGVSKTSNECGGTWKECDANGECVERSQFLEKGTICGNTTRPILTKDVCGGEWSECDGKGKCVKRNNFLEAGTTCGVFASNETLSGCITYAKICNGRGTCLERTRQQPDGTKCGNDTISNNCMSQSGVCQNGVCVRSMELVKAGTLCGKTVISECSTVTYACDEKGECVSTIDYKAKGVSCGVATPQTNVCQSVRSQCDGEGHCLHIYENAASGTLCGEDEDKTGKDGDKECGGLRNACDGHGKCVLTERFLEKGTLCGVSRTSTSACGTSHGECNGAGKCVQVNKYSAAGTLCGPTSEKVCSTDTSTCDGAGKCIKTKSVTKKPGDSCGEPQVYPCKTVNLVCDENGHCGEKVEYAKAGLSCGERQKFDCGIVEAICDGNGVCMNSTTFKSTDSMCRAASSECDLAEYCDGTSLECPADKVRPVGTDCGKPKHEGCTLYEGKCTKSGECKSVATKLEDGTPCGENGACGTSTCKDGVCVVVPKPAGTICIGGGEDISVDGSNACVEQAVCDGSSVNCPEPKYHNSTHVCRPAKGPCDVAEYCTGSSPDCPEDVLRSDGYVCRKASGPCDIEEVCNGTSWDCPADAVQKAGKVCREARGPCDAAEVCDGESAVCPKDEHKPAGTVCRERIFEYCDSPAVCDGVSDECPEPAFGYESCGPNGEGLCQSRGKCALYEAKTSVYAKDECVDDSQCDDGNPCTVDTCSQDLKCVHTPGNAGTVCSKATYAECDADALCTGTSAQCPESKVPTDQRCGLNEDGECAGRGECVIAPYIVPESCSEDDECDDGNPCSVSTCENGKCVSLPGNKGALCRKKRYSECDAEAYCTGEDLECPETLYVAQDEACGIGGRGKCKGKGDCLIDSTLGQALKSCQDDDDCDDGNPCTVDKCYEGKFCVHTPGNKGQVCRSAQYTSCDAPDVCDGVNADCPKNSTYVAKYEPCSKDGSYVCVGRGDCEKIEDEDELAEAKRAQEALEQSETDEQSGRTDNASNVSGGELKASDKEPKLCFGDEHCDDGLPCTVDTCVDGVCKHTPGNKGYVCGPPRFDVCDSNDVCDGKNTYCPTSVFVKNTRCGTNGVCTARGVCSEQSSDLSSSALCYSDAHCDDDNPCTIDKCNEQHICVHVPGNAGSVCRAQDPAKPCDLPEYCDGINADCPPETVDKLCLEQHELNSIVDDPEEDADELLTRYLSNSTALNAADVLKEEPTDDFSDTGAPADDVDVDDVDGPETSPEQSLQDYNALSDKNSDTEYRSGRLSYAKHGVTKSEVAIMAGMVSFTVAVMCVTLAVMSVKQRKRTKQAKKRDDTYIAI